MPYTHSGELGDIWKHLPLCDILKIEVPIRYHETNSAYAGYTIKGAPRTEYGILKLLAEGNVAFTNSTYCKALRKNGIEQMYYTGSPGLAMSILGNSANYFFHDLEREALDSVAAFASERSLKAEIFHGDSICAFLDDGYQLNENDFVFLDPYSPLDNNEQDFNFFDIFDKAIRASSKTLMWYGYMTIAGQQEILGNLRGIAEASGIAISTFDLWQKDMSINPGVPGCGLACANVSEESVSALTQYLCLVEEWYATAEYMGSPATLLTQINHYR